MNMPIPNVLLPEELRETQTEKEKPVREAREELEKITDASQGYYTLPGGEEVLCCVSPLPPRDGIEYYRIRNSLGGMVVMKDVPRSEVRLVEFYLRRRKL